MKLYHFPTSPYVRKVVVLLHETGQLADVELVNTQTAPGAPAANLTPSAPLGKIPALERPDGPALYDSRVICAYLDARAGAGLYGDGAQRWDTLTIEATADGIMDAAILMVYEKRVRPEDKQYQDWIEAQWGKVERAVAALNQRWMSHLQGPLDMGQIAVACALSYLDFRHGDRDWRFSNDALADWHKGFEARPSMTRTVPPST